MARRCSQLDNPAWAQVIKPLTAWIGAAIQGKEIAENDDRWSPAGDGGFLSFQSLEAWAKAVLVARSLARILREPQRNKSGVQMKFALHSGQVLEADEPGRVSNIWGEGINAAKYSEARLTCSKGSCAQSLRPLAARSMYCRPCNYTFTTLALSAF